MRLYTPLLCAKFQGKQSDNAFAFYSSFVSVRQEKEKYEEKKNEETEPIFEGDVRVFNPLAASNASSSLASCYRRHENIKKRAYAQRIREEEHASFTPLVMSASGGLAHEASVFYQRLAHQLSNKWGDDYSVVMGWLRCCLSFSLLRSSIQCIRGARSSIGHYVKTPPIVELIRAESQFAVD